MADFEYDNEVFFQEYAKTTRSQLVLTGAGEWHMLQPLFPDLQGNRILDLGCGYTVTEKLSLPKYLHQLVPYRILFLYRHCFHAPDISMFHCPIASTSLR